LGFLPHPLWDLKAHRNEIARYILLDTNAFYADLHGLGTSSASLTQGVERLHYLLLVPEVVQDETIEKYRHDLMATAASYHQIAAGTV
jgi:homoserine kinase